ncbi:MAG: WD40/YVTN/BNR-like repeat-containing protein [Candidatus Binataceae bacterium]
MRLCVGTAKGIVILDPDRASIPLMVLADPTGIWCMAQDCADPAVIYAGGVEHVRGKGTLSRSTDGGRTWTDISPTAAREEEVWALAASPAVKDQVFAGTSHARVLRSDDRGRSFHECAGFLKIPGRERWTFPPPPHIPHVRSISFDPHDPRTMYVGVEEGGVFRTRDGGVSFETLNDGLYADIHTVAADPADSRRLYATTGRGFYVSENAGASWRHVRSGINRTYTVPLLVDGDAGATIFTAAAAGPPPTWSGSHSGADAIVYQSRDRGASFTPLAVEHMSGRGMVMRLRSDPRRAGFIGVTTDGQVIRTLEGGGAVAAIAEKLPPAHDLVTLP